VAKPSVMAEWMETFTGDNGVGLRPTLLRQQTRDKACSPRQIISVLLYFRRSYTTDRRRLRIETNM